MNKDQDERMPAEYELELARGMANELLAAYPPANDGSEDRMEVHAARTINRLVGKARNEAKFREALDKIGHMFDHEEWYGENALSMRDIALEALKDE